MPNLPLLALGAGDFTHRAGAKLVAGAGLEPILIALNRNGMLDEVLLPLGRRWPSKRSFAWRRWPDEGVGWGIQLTPKPPHPNPLPKGRGNSSLPLDYARAKNALRHEHW